MHTKNAIKSRKMKITGFYEAQGRVKGQIPVVRQSMGLWMMFHTQEEMGAKTTGRKEPGLRFCMAGTQAIGGSRET